MATRIIAVSPDAVGQVLSEDVVSTCGVTLVAKGTVLNYYIIERLTAFDVVEVFCYLPSEENVPEPGLLAFRRDYYQCFAEIKDVITGLATEGKLRVAAIHKISDLLYSTMQHSGSMVSSLQLLSSVDSYTYTHSLNTAMYSFLIGKWMGFSPQELKSLIQGGLLHDIGKARVPQELLNKQGSLTMEEFDIIKQHVPLGDQILEESGDWPLEVRDAVRFHHERVDGSGYPYQRRFAEVCCYARIVAVADAFDAITSNRVYKRAGTPFDAFAVFQTSGLGTFDVSVVNIFLRNVAPYYVGSNVLLSSRERGRIVYLPPHDVTSPVIALGDRVVDMSKVDLRILSILH